MTQVSGADNVRFVGEPRPRRVRWKRWALVGSLMLLVAAGAVAWAVAALIVPRRPRPVITTLIRVQPPQSMFGEDRTAQEGGVESILETYRQLIVSNNVLAATATNLDRTQIGWSRSLGDRNAYLRDGIRARRVPRTWLIAVTAPGLPADQQGPALDALTESFLRLLRFWHDSHASTLLVDLRAQHEHHQETLAQRRTALREAVASNAAPEVLDPLRDAVAIGEDISRRLGVAVELREMESRQILQTRVVMQAQPWTEPD